jgi:hypothetical protein
MEQLIRQEDIYASNISCMWSGEALWHATVWKAPKIIGG